MFGMGTGGPSPQSTPTIFVPPLGDENDYSITALLCQLFFIKKLKNFFGGFLAPRNSLFYNFSTAYGTNAKHVTAALAECFFDAHFIAV